MKTKLKLKVITANRLAKLAIGGEIRVACSEGVLVWYIDENGERQYSCAVVL